MCIQNPSPEETVARPSEARKKRVGRGMWEITLDNLRRKGLQPIIDLGESLETVLFFRFPPAFLFSHHLTAATASPRGKRLGCSRTSAFQSKKSGMDFRPYRILFISFVPKGLHNPQSGYHIAKQYFTAQRFHLPSGRFHCIRCRPASSARGPWLPSPGP